MNKMPSQLTFSVEIPFDSSKLPNFQLLDWPPRDDWPIITDKDGNLVSRWGDSKWRLDPWAGKSIVLNFGDGPPSKHVAAISIPNAKLLRIIIGWWIYGPYAARGYRGLKTRFDQIRKIFVLCSEEGILVSELHRYKRVWDRIPDIIQPSRANELLNLLSELYESRKNLGFVILDKAGLTFLASNLPKISNHQTPYIPPRIWIYQVNRLRECLEDFHNHKDRIEKCFRFCLGIYQTRSMKDRKIRSSVKSLNRKSSFETIARKFLIYDLMERWVGVDDKKLKILSLFNYFNLISRVGLSYLLNFSLMRVEEGWNLKSDCLRIEDDPKFGRMYLLRGSSSKTITDPESVWITSPHVTVAIEAMQHIASLRIEAGRGLGLYANNINNKSHFLIGYGVEPWGTMLRKVRLSLRPSIPGYQNLISRFPRLFDLNTLKITEDDLRIARLVTPSLAENFSVGRVWPLAWHQLRRTGSVNMQASGIVSDLSLQFQLKHVVKAMSLYYGQNHSRVRLEQDSRKLYVRTMYEILGKQLQLVTSERFISPHGDKRKSEIVRLISTNDAKTIVKYSQNGTISYRPILLGICMHRTPCPYGGIDNIAHCGGGDSVGVNKPCADVLYDSTLHKQVDDLDEILNQRLQNSLGDSPLRTSLLAQKISVENYRNVIRSKQNETKN